MHEFEKYKNIVYQTIGAAMDVYNELGFGLREPVYQESLEIELHERGIKCEREKNVSIYYKQYELKQYYKLDFLVEDKIIVELKSASELTSDHRSQLFNYMRLTHLPVGLLINFGDTELLQGERYIQDSNNVCHRVDKNMQPI